MKNAIFSGLIIGIVSALWLVIMQLFGLYPKSLEQPNHNYMVYTSLLVPLFGLHFGIKGYKKEKRGRLNFIESILQGFKIIAIGGSLTAIFIFLYHALFIDSYQLDYMELTFAGVMSGLLFTLFSSLILMNKSTIY